MKDTVTDEERFDSKEEELLGMYDDMLEQLVNLNTESKEIKKLYEKTKNELNKLSTIVSKQITVIESQQKTLASHLKQIQQTEKTLDIQIDKVETQRKDLDSSIRTIEKAAQNALADIEKKQEAAVKAIDGARSRPVPKPSANVKEVSPKAPAIDYSEIDSIEGLYNKYGQYMRHPMIVVRSTNHPWTGDYCFAVEMIKGKDAFGKVYKNGEPHLNREGINDKKHSAQSQDFSIYNGPSEKNILRNLPHPNTKTKYEGPF